MRNRVEILVKKPGMLTTVQDKGRKGYQAFGVPEAGAMDKEAMLIANRLVGQDENNPVLEITLMGLELEFRGQVYLAVTGGNLSPKLNGVDLPMYSAVEVKNRDILKFPGIKSGARAYLAFSGKLEAEKIMGSTSTYLRGEFGGFKGRKLLQGDILNVECEECEFRELPGELIRDYSQTTIRIVLNRFENDFKGSGIRTLLENEYVLSSLCDRMGYRLEGPEIKHRKSADIISTGINFGTIQVPGHGKPIIMMADHQTVGGYTQIGRVISADLPCLAQKLPGSKIRFQEISLREAQDLQRSRLGEIRENI